MWCAMRAVCVSCGVVGWVLSNQVFIQVVYNSCSLHRDLRSLFKTFLSSIQCVYTFTHRAQEKKLGLRGNAARRKEILAEFDQLQEEERQRLAPWM